MARDESSQGDQAPPMEEVEAQEAPRYHAAVTDVIRGHGSKYNLQESLGDWRFQKEAAAQVVTLDHVARTLLPEKDPENVDTIQRIIKMAETSVGNSPYDIPNEASPLFYNASEMGESGTRMDLSSVIKKGFLHISGRKRAEMRNIPGILKAGHLALIFEQMSSTRQEIGNMIQTLSDGATCYRFEGSENAELDFDTVCSRGDRRTTKKTKHIPQETYHLPVEQQVDVLNTMLVNEMLKYGKSSDYFINNPKVLDKLPETVTLSEKGFLVMEGENEEEVEAHYFSLRDKLAKQMQETLGTDEPLTEKQVRESYGKGKTEQSSLREKLSAEQRTSAGIAEERDAAKADVASSSLRLEQERREKSTLEERVALLEAQIAAMKAQNEAAKSALEKSGFGGRANAIKSALSALKK